MLENYTFDDESKLIALSDDELYHNHVIGDDLDLDGLNNLVADYFTSYKHI